MSKENRQMKADFAFGLAGMIAATIDKVQKVVKAPMSTVMRVADDYPKFLILKWIPQGVELALAFTNEGLSYKLYEPEGLIDYPIEYQETLEMIHESMREQGFAKIRGETE